MVRLYSTDSVLNFGWINCDRFYDDPRPKTGVEIILKGKEIKQYGATVFVILPEINSVLCLWQDQNDYNKASFGNNRLLPIGMKAHFIALAKVDNEYFLSKKINTVISNNYIGTMHLEKKSIDAIKKEIAQL